MLVFKSKDVFRTFTPAPFLWIKGLSRILFVGGTDLCPNCFRKTSRASACFCYLILVVPVVVSAVFIAFPGVKTRAGTSPLWDRRIMPQSTGILRSSRSPTGKRDHPGKRKGCAPVVYIDTVRKVSGGRFMVPRFFRTLRPISRKPLKDRSSNREVPVRIHY